MKLLVKFRKSVMTAVKILIVFAMVLGFMNVWYNYYDETIYSRNGNYVVIFSYLLLFMLFSELYGGFKIGINRLHEIIYSLSLSAFITNLFIYLELSLIARELVSPFAFFGGCVYQVAVIFIGSYCANIIYFRLYGARKMIAVFADDEEGKAIIKKMSKIPKRFAIERGISVNRASVSEIKELIDKYEAVLLCDFDKQLKSELLNYCCTHSKRTYLLPSSTDVVVRNSDQIQISDTPILMCRNRGLRFEHEIVKRVFDIIIATTGIIITLPIMLITAVAVKLCDGGPIFFKQKRVTKNGKVFNMVKFRSMVVDAENHGAKKTEEEDARITPVGKVIRYCRIDELPQLFNILFGDMSAVGPRPECVENVCEYVKIYPDFNLRHRVKSGLTGYAQVYGKYNTSPEDKLKMDLIYIEQYSIFLDLKLLIMTLKILFMRESTEGFKTERKKKKIKNEKGEKL